MPANTNENSNESKKKILKPEDIKRPEYAGKTEVTIHEDLIFFVTTDYDDCAENPCDWDAVGKIHSFNRKHVDYLQGFDFPSTKEECRSQLIEKYGNDIVFLGYYEHGECVWFVEGMGGPGTECRWDGTQFAGCWVPDAELLRQVRYRDKLKKGTPERAAKMIEWAKQACTVYTDWCNGHVYGYQITAYKLKLTGDGEVYDSQSDYRFEDELACESCSGYYGDDIEEGITDGIKSVIATLMEKESK